MADSQSPTPSGGNPEGTDLHSVARSIEGLLDDDGHYNPSGRASRAVDPDSYSTGEDEGGGRSRDQQGRFTAAEQTDETPDQDAELDQAAASDVVDEDTPAGDTDERLADSADEVTESDDAGTDAPIQTIAQMAEALEMSVDDFKANLTHQFRAANEDVEVTLAELEKGYQRDADYRKGTTENANIKRQYEFENAQRMQAFEQQHQYLAAHLNATEEMIAAKLNSPQLAELRNRDPGEWNAVQTEIGQELALIRQRRQEAAQQYGDFVTSQLTELKGRELDALQKAMPDFTNQHADYAREAMRTLGYMPEEVSQIFDHRLVLGALELHNLREEVHQLRAEKERAQTTVQRVKQDVPQLMQPGKRRAATPAAQLQRDNVAKLKNRAAKSGSVEDAAAVIESLMQ